jgi:hypothetical protein
MYLPDKIYNKLYPPQLWKHFHKKGI